MLDHAYQWMILQEGSLPLKPNGRVTPLVEHACTATLVWPVGQKPARNNALIVDPCLTAKGFRQAAERLQALDTSIDEIACYFTTHNHADHQPRVPAGISCGDWLAWDQQAKGDFAGLHTRSLPGHARELCGLTFESNEGETWIVGDAVLNLQWLQAWRFYYPNGYSPPEVEQTWRSVAATLAEARVVIPGHGPPIPVTLSLLEELLANFQSAAYSDRCGDVYESLRQTRERLARAAERSR